MEKNQLATVDPQPNYSREGLVALAVEKGATPEQLLKFIEADKEYQLIADQREFVRRKANVQGKLRQVQKKRQTEKSEKGHTYKFGSVDDLMNEAQPLLAEEGISVAFVQNRLDNREKIFATVCRLSYGLYSEDTPYELAIPAIPFANDTQKVGGASTYIRRYALQMALNFSFTDRDVDAENLIANATTEQVESLLKQIKESDSDEQRFLAWAAKSSGQDAMTWDRFPESLYEPARNMLRNKILKKQRQGG